MLIPKAKPLATLLAIAFLPLAAGCASSTHAPEFTPTDSTREVPAAATALIGDGQPPLRIVVADINAVPVALEVADDPEERRDGLSRRDGLTDDAGMLFVWDNEDSHSLWMRQMRFALDFVWLDADKQVVSINTDVPVQPDAQDSDLVLYRPDGPVMYAIELEAGEAARLGVQVGDVVAFEAGAD